MDFFLSLNQFERTDSSHVTSTAPGGSFSPSLAVRITTASVFVPNVFLLFRDRQTRQVTSLFFFLFFLCHHAVSRNKSAAAFISKLCISPVTCSPSSNSEWLYFSTVAWAPWRRLIFSYSSLFFTTEWVPLCPPFTLLPLSFTRVFEETLQPNCLLTAELSP